MKISIITPSFNQAQFLEQTIKSVVSQDYKNIEYLIYDGGSTDGSVEIIKKYARKYPNIIKWQSKKDKGQVDAINQGLKKATGDVVAFLNSDDYYLPGAFKKVFNYFNANPKSQWLVGNCRVTDPNLKWTFAVKHLLPIQTARFWLYLFNWVNQPAVFLRKMLITRVGEFNQKYHYAFDYDYWLRCLQNTLPSRLYQPLAVFRVHTASKSSLGFSHQFKEQRALTKKYTKSSFVQLVQFLGQQTTVFFYSLVKSKK